MVGRALGPRLVVLRLNSSSPQLAKSRSRPFSRFMCYTVYVPKNLTLVLDEELLRAARKVAIDRNTSVNQLVRDFLARLVRESGQRQSALARVEEIFRTTQIQVGRRTWKREDLHER